MLYYIRKIKNYILNPKYSSTANYKLKEKWCIFFISILYLYFVNKIILKNIPNFIDNNVVSLRVKESNLKITVAELLTLTLLLAPLLEELVFRLPLKFTTNFLFVIDSKGKIETFWEKNFKPIFYLFTFLFASIHISNYQNNEPVFYLLAILILLPHFFAGLILGYLRMNLGFWWGVLAHFTYNFVILLPYFFLANNFSYEKKEDTFYFKIEELSFYENKESKQINFNKKTVISIDWNDETVQKLIDTLYKKKYKVVDNHLAKISLTTTKPLPKEKFLAILKEEYRIVEKDSLKK